MLVAQDFGSVDAMNDLLVSPDFDFDLDPFIRREGGCGGLDDMLGDELAVDFEIGARGADIAGRAFPFSFVGEKLELEADGKFLVEVHALRGLGVDHESAIEIHELGGIGHHLSGEAVFHSEAIVGVGDV